MIDLVNFEKQIKQYSFENSPKVAVGVSGGPDSIALVYLTNKWILKKKGKLIALLIDHRLRDESYFECLKTQKFLKKFKINSLILRVPKKNISNKMMGQARKNRFEKLINYCKKNKIFYLFLGHHSNDNLETFLIRKIAGSNFEGLNSIQSSSIFKGIQIIRPLLKFSKKDIIKFNKKFSLSYIVDPSNTDEKYTRSIVRKYLDENNSYKKEVNKELNLIKKNYKDFNKIIFQILNLILIDIKQNSVQIDQKKFFSLNIEIKIKLTEIILKYVNKKNTYLRYSNVRKLINDLENTKKSSFRSQNAIITKNMPIISVVNSN